VEAQDKEVSNAEKHKVPVVSVDFINTVSEVTNVAEVMQNSLIDEWTKPDEVRPRLLTFNSEFEKPKTCKFQLS
jgi:hypothetical protein